MKFAGSVPGRLLIAAFCVAATQAAVWHVQHRTGLAATQAAAFDVTGLPLQFGPWSGTPTDLDLRLFQQVGALSMVNRSYQNDIGRQASVHLSTFPTADVTLPHPPDLCCTSAGWTVLQDDWQHDSHDRNYRWMIIERNGARAGVAYWYQLGSDVASNREELRKILQKLRWRGASWPPLVKVLMQVPIEFSEGESKASVEELGAGIYDWVKAGS